MTGPAGRIHARATPGPVPAERRGLLPWTLLVLLVAVALPLHLCMPLWCDNSFYDVSARMLLRGEMLYREVFYYLLPGMALLQAGLRALLGWRSEVLRGFDFLIALGVIQLLCFRVVPGPRRHPLRVWTALALLFFYLGTSEFCHAQPDLWMALPALVALVLRIRQAGDLQRPEVGAGRLVRRALLEGVAWAVAFAIKPVVFLPGLACFLLTAARARRTAGRVATDLAGVLAGGAIVGLPLLAWLVASGNWPYLWENVSSGWFADYRGVSAGGFARSVRAFSLLWPWGLTHLAALPLALVLAATAARAPRAATPGATSGDGVALGLLATGYLAWFVTAHFVQYQLEYHALPPILLGLALLAGWALRRGGVRLWAAAMIGLVLWAGRSHPLLRPVRLAMWPYCLSEGASPRVRDVLKVRRGHAASPSHVDLERVADYLRRQGVGDRELTCYSLSSLGLYATLDLRPSSRYVQLTTMLEIAPQRRDEILAAVRSGPQRFVVVDLRDPPVRLHARHDTVELPPGVLDRFPYDEPIVFRSGRYLVHRVRRPEDPPFERPPGPLAIPPAIPDDGAGL